MGQGEGDAEWCTQDEWVVVDLLNDQVEPGVEFFIIHFELVGSDAGLAHSVLDGPNDSLHSPNVGVMLGQSSFEFYGGELEVEGGYHLHFFLSQIFARSSDIDTCINPDDARCSSQSKCTLETSGYTLGTVAVEELQVYYTTEEAQNNQNPSLELNIILECKDR